MGLSPAGVRRVGAEEAARVLEGGGLVAHPTSTVYGLGGRPTAALDREIARLKGRSAARPLIRLAAGVEEVRARCAAGWSPAAEALAGRFWPGPLTLVLRAGGADEVAVRVDSHAGLRAMLERAGGWMTSTSLNAHGGAPARSADEAAETLAALGPARVPLVLLDGGELVPSAPSTIVSLVGERPGIVRAGAVAAVEVERILRAAEPSRGGR